MNCPRPIALAAILLPGLALGAAEKPVPPGQPDEAEPEFRIPSQGEENELAYTQFKKFDTELTGLYEELVRQEKNPAFRETLVAAQSAWEGFRNADARLESVGLEGASARTQFVNQRLAYQTKLRIYQLKTPFGQGWANLPASIDLPPGAAKKPDSSSQTEQNEQALAEFKQVDAELTRVYEQELAKLEKSPAARETLIASQRAWLAFRGADFRCEFLRKEGASARTQFVNQRLAYQTKLRIYQLQTPFVQGWISLPGITDPPVERSPAPKPRAKPVSEPREP